MLIACPNCGASLELPEESVGAKVQYPVCEMSFVSSGSEEWKKLGDLQRRYYDAVKRDDHARTEEWVPLWPPLTTRTVRA